MGYYSIKNITNKLPKRHSKKDSSLIIHYNVGFKPSKYELKPNEEIFISCKTIPSNIQLLRIKSLVWVKEISENVFLKNKIENDSTAESGSKVIVTKKQEIVEKKELKNSERKRTVKKVIKVKDDE